MVYTPTPKSTTTDLTILDPELRPLIERFPRTTELATEAATVVAFMRAIPVRPHVMPGVTKCDIQVSTSTSDANQPPTTVRLYIPDDPTGSHSTFPVIMWMHHGGFFSFGPMQLDAFCSTIAFEAKVVVVSPAFRQTPENPFPASFNDTYQVLLWLTTSSEVSAYSIDPTRIAVGGTSAGGTLAVGICLKFRDENRRPHIRLLILDDASFTDRSNSYSTASLPITKVWNANVTRFMWDMYLPGGSAALERPLRDYAVPALTQNLRGLPPTLVLCAQWDDLTNDGIAFALRLLETGIPTEIHTYRGTFHISDKLMHDAKPSAKKRRDIIESIIATFEEKGT